MRNREHEPLDSQLEVLEVKINQLFRLLIAVLLILAFIVAAKAQTTERPGVTACAHEPHAHQDEDLRIHMAVRITSANACGFNWETEHEVGRLEFAPELAVATTDMLPTGGNTTIVTVRDIRKGRIALVVYCSYCKSAMYVGLVSEVKEKK